MCAASSPIIATKKPQNTSQVYSSSEFLAVQPNPTLAERSFSEDREEGWERSIEGDSGRRLSTDLR